jgi:hypothetical protein
VAGAELLRSVTRTRANGDYISWTVSQVEDAFATCRVYCVLLSRCLARIAYGVHNYNALSQDFLGQTNERRGSGCN